MYKYNIELEQVLKMYNEENKNQGDIAKHYGCSLATMSNFFKLHNIDVEWNKNRNYRIKHNVEKIINDYTDDKLSMSQIAKNHRVGRNIVFEYLKDHNIEKRDPRKYQLNENYFEKIDTAEKAYWLGFLYADGYNHQTKASVVVQLATQDKLLLDNLKNNLDSDIPIIEYTEPRSSVRLTINSRKMSDDLAKHGCVQAKTFILNYPSIDSSLNSHFIRGYFDGDGCITETKGAFSFEVAGTETLLLKMQDILMTECGLEKTKLNPRSNIYILRYGGNTQVKRIQPYLYKDATISLQRKKDKFDKLMQTVQIFRADYGDLETFRSNFTTKTWQELEQIYGSPYQNIRGYAKRFKIPRPKHLIDWSKKITEPKFVTV